MFKRPLIKTSLPFKDTHQWQILDFPTEEGCQPSRDQTYYFGHFSQKLHEIDIFDRLPLTKRINI